MAVEDLAGAEEGLAEEEGFVVEFLRAEAHTSRTLGADGNGSRPAGIRIGVNYCSRHDSIYSSSSKIEVTRSGE